MVDQHFLGAGAFTSSLASDSVRAEINHLFWSAPFLNNGVRDLGWNCRDHALVVGALARVYGMRAMALSGRAAFVSVAGARRVGVEQQPHTWVLVEGVGTCDFSVRLDQSGAAAFAADHRRACVLANKLQPNASDIFVSSGSQNKFEAAYNNATHLDEGMWAGYHMIEAEPITEDLIYHALKWCNSPLSVNLKKRSYVHSDIYAKAVLQLYEFQQGLQPSLTGLNQMLAWKRIAKRPGNGKTALLKLLGSRSPQALSSARV